MATRTFLHIGAPKAGSTFLQSVLWQNRSALREAGLLVPGRSMFDHNLAAIAVRNPEPRTPLQERAARTWPRLQARIREWGDAAVLSNEWFCWANPDQAERALAVLAPSEVHLVFTGRALAYQVPAAWQETLKLGSGLTVEEFVASLDQHDARWSWSTLDPAESLRRWARTLPDAQVHLVTVPPRGSDPGLLWDRFCTVLGVDPRAHDRSTARANESLGVESAMLLQRIGPELRRAIDADASNWVEPYRWIRTYLAQQLLVPRGGRKIRFPSEVTTALRSRAEHSVRTLAAKGYHVVGSLDDLLPSEVASEGGEPAEVSTEEMLDVAALLIADLLTDVRRQTLRGDRAEREGRDAESATADDRDDAAASDLTHKTSATVARRVTDRLLGRRRR
jgi:hypothetical protein